MRVIPGPEFVTWLSSPNGPAVVYEYITNTNESNPALLTAAEVLLRPLAIKLTRPANTFVAPPSRRLSVTALQKTLLTRKVKGFRRGPIHPNHPQRPSQIPRTGSRATHLQPAPIFFVRPVGVHENIAVAILRTRLGHGDFLVPAVLSTDWVRL